MLAFNAFYSPWIWLLMPVWGFLSFDTGCCCHESKTPNGVSITEPVTVYSSFVWIHFAYFTKSMQKQALWGYVYVENEIVWWMWSVVAGGQNDVTYCLLEIFEPQASRLLEHYRAHNTRCTYLERTDVRTPYWYDLIVNRFFFQSTRIC